MEPNHFEQLYPEKTRFEEIKKIIEILRTGRSCQVVGIPGVGKSNVLRLLPYNRSVRELHLGSDEPSYHFIYMDFSEVRERNIFDIVKFMYICLSYSLGERRLTSEQEIVNQHLKEALEFNDELILFQGLKKSVDFLAKEKGFYLVFLFDRFEDYVPNIDPKFFLNLKILRSRVKFHFLCIFATTRPIEDVLEPQVFSEFNEYLIGNTVFLPIKDAPGLEFRFKYLEEVTGKKSDEKAKEEIEKLTGGHGKLAKLCFEAHLAEPDQKDFAEHFLTRKQIRGALFEVWNFLTPEEINDVEESRANTYLEKVFLQEGGKITIPLFEKYATTTPQTPQKISYDADKNEFIRGTEIITDKFTPSEFRLLRHLMINTGRVSEKNEIIEAVWNDSKTREGVTDQALDQIVYRLRRKIEDDPNNPKLIQTVKGRGYKFNP
jgi:DNA-binding winged helix-turn-helix (wHTH) protein